MISIQLNKKLDKEIYLDFCDLKFAGANFGERIKKDHPNLNKNNYSEYIDSYYKENKEQLESAVNELQKEIANIEPNIFQSLKNIFGVDFSDEKYVGYLSIFDINPRFLDTKTFQVYCQRDLLGKIEVVIHEITHFAFFAYCNKFLPEITGKLDKNSGPLWELSEIFNIIILNQPDFIEITKREELLFYPELKDKLTQIEKVWRDTGVELNDFITKSLAVLDDKAT